MTASVILDFRFAGTPGGAVWTRTNYGHSFWRRYLTVFDELNVVARVQTVTSLSGDWQRVDGPGVRVTPVPNYLGPREYLVRRRAVRRAVQSACRPGQAVIIRAPSQLGNIQSARLFRAHHPFGLEVGGDPYESFAPGSAQYFLRPIYRVLFTRALKKQCRQAQSVAYVTESTLQRRYPCGGFSIGASDVEIPPESLSSAARVFTTFYSNVELRDEAFVKAPTPHPARSVATLVLVGSLNQMYKGADVLLDAADLCLKRGRRVQVVIVGDGKHRAHLENQAVRLGIAGHVRFLGEIPGGAPVRAQLDRADIFVLPSRTEGLPRAMIEAMARGLPCIGTAVGGMVELLPVADLVPPGQAAPLAAKIEEFLSDPPALEKRSMRNLNKAREYRDDILAERRNAFYRYLRDCTAAWTSREWAVAGTAPGQAWVEVAK